MESIAEKYEKDALPLSGSPVLPFWMKQEGVGTGFVGRYDGALEVRTKDGSTFKSHRFALIEGDCRWERGNEFVTPAVGDTVQVSGTIIDRCLLDQLHVGRNVMVIYRGEGTGRKGGKTKLVDVSLLPK